MYRQPAEIRHARRLAPPLAALAPHLNAAQDALQTLLTIATTPLPNPGEPGYVLYIIRQNAAFDAIHQVMVTLRAMLPPRMSAEWDAWRVRSMEVVRHTIREVEAGRPPGVRRMPPFAPPGARFGLDRQRGEDEIEGDFDPDFDEQPRGRAGADLDRQFGNMNLGGRPRPRDPSPRGQWGNLPGGRHQYPGHRGLRGEFGDVDPRAQAAALAASLDPLPSPGAPRTEPVIMNDEEGTPTWMFWIVAQNPAAGMADKAQEARVRAEKRREQKGGLFDLVAAAAVENGRLKRVGRKRSEL
ncbi:hypothetical protein EJ06DRAFT_519038 [Trichodelitschia bisporula]|uniref:Uncharacterized protein n=1 Tax=Trichodelitschia bisporula TaxID=703511 RepID=A0A6G1I8N6_9PEZI|nr:hypothetical protein EJ06DRAFT_519038 [Trichodelitschia bisporula]